MFRRKFGETLGNVVKLYFGGKHTVEVGYSSSTGCVNGLLQIIKYFHLMENYILLFTYNGNSAFSVMVYDSQCMNHLRDVDGYCSIADFESTEVESGLDDGMDEGTPI